MGHEQVLEVGVKLKCEVFCFTWSQWQRGP